MARCIFSRSLYAPADIVLSMMPSRVPEKQDICSAHQLGRGTMSDAVPSQVRRWPDERRRKAMLVMNQLSLALYTGLSGQSICRDRCY